MIIKNEIIPKKQIRVGLKDELDLKSIAVFSALGFFLEDTTYYKGLKNLLPGTINHFNELGNLTQSQKYFEWHYSPRNISFDSCVSEFTDLLHEIVKKNDAELYTIALSGGLDSRTLLAAALNSGKEIQCYSYEFENGHKETRYGEAMAKAYHLPMKSLVVPKGSLWNYIDDIALKNECYAEFTNARQFACFNDLKAMNGTFLLGHGGDLFFDDMGIDDDVNLEGQLNVLWNRLIKNSGLNLAQDLWSNWGIEGDFILYLKTALKLTLDKINIKEANPKLRAFKSSYYVPRWTCTNLQIFEDFGPNLIPYFDDRMCEWICEIPEKWLSGRKIQIEYLKKNAPTLAKIPWQSHLPFNLYNYQYNISPLNYPYRIAQKIKRLSNLNNLTQRNWENQFIGEENRSHLRENLFDDQRFHDWIPKNIIEKYLNGFESLNSLQYYPSITMLLTLKQFDKHFR